MPVSIPINTLATLSSSRVTGKETLPAVQIEGGNAYTYQVAVSSLFYPNSIGTDQLQDGSVIGSKLGDGAPKWNTSGTLSLSGNLEVGSKTSSPLTLSLGYDRAAAGDTSILMYSDVGTIPDATIVRKTGTNGAFELTNTGTGFLTLKQTAGSPITFQTNSVERARITSAGRVGIGTISPRAELDVAGTVVSTSMSATNATFPSNVSQSLTDGAIILPGTGGAIVIDNNGHKRISWNDGGGNLIIRAGNYYNGTNTVFVKDPGSSNGGASTMTFDSDGIDGAITLQVAGIGVPGATVSYDNSVRLTKDNFYTPGNVGVGVVSPTEKLEVSGTVKSTAIETTGSATINGGTDLGQFTRTGTSVTTGETNIGLGYNRTGSGVSKLLLYGRAGSGATGYTTLQKEGGDNGNTTLSDTGTGTLYFTKNNAAGTIRFQTGGTNDRMTILANGNVGIATVTPTTPLEVNGAVKAVSYNSTSSLRYKENVKPLEGALDIVSKLNSVRFDWKKDGKSDIGLIAEEVDKVLPELVLKNDQGEPDAIDYGKLTSILIGAINEIKSTLK